MKKRTISILAIFSFILLTSGLLTAQDKMDDKKMDNDAKKSCCSSKAKDDTTCTDAPKSCDLTTMDKNKDGKVYQCSMCPDQLSDSAGECPKCGMNLSEVSIEDAKKNCDAKGSGMMDHDKMEGHKDHSNIMEHKMDSGKMKMKTDNIIREGEIDLTAIDQNKDGKVYEDMMCWNVISDTAGECPKCGMTLKEVSLDKAKENLLKHDYKVK